MNKYKILLVEDDAINSLAMFSALEDVYTVTAVSKAEDAIAQAEKDHYDVILMDIHLKKGKNGIEATEEIRKINGYQNTPIIAMTAYTRSYDETEYLNMGFTHYISKPFSSKKLVIFLKEILTEDNS